MKRSEMIKDFRIKKGLNQANMAKLLGFTGGYISQVENEITKPSIKFLDKLKEVFGQEVDYILLGGPSDQIEIELQGGPAEYAESEKKIMLFREKEVRYQILPTSTKKLLDNMVEILESGNEVMIDAMKGNIKALLSAVRNKSENENKGGD